MKAMENILAAIGKKRAPQDLKARAEADAKIVGRCQGGDLKAFEELVRKYMPAAVGMAMGYLRNVEEAVDISQDAFVRALEALPRFDVARPFFPWFYVLLKNACLNRLRRLGRPREIPLDELNEGNEPAEKGTEAKHFSDAVRSAVARLSSEHREVVLLRHWRDLSYDEIAALTGLPVGTVMSRLHYARKQLRETLAGLEES
jgi:RNA polymerase sigma-70 factor (ECF subfamily)